LELDDFRRAWNGEGCSSKTGDGRIGPLRVAFSLSSMDGKTIGRFQVNVIASILIIESISREGSEVRVSKDGTHSRIQFGGRLLWSLNASLIGVPEESFSTLTDVVSTDLSSASASSVARNEDGVFTASTGSEVPSVPVSTLASTVHALLSCFIAGRKADVPVFASLSGRFPDLTGGTLAG